MSEASIAPGDYHFSAIDDIDNVWEALKGSTAGIRTRFMLAIPDESGRTARHEELDVRVVSIRAVPSTVDLEIVGSAIIDVKERRLSIYYDSKEPMKSRCYLGW